MVALLVVAVGHTLTAVAGDLDYRCKLVATRLGEQITVTYRLRTNQPHDDWRVRLLHEGERIFSRVRTTNAAGRIKVVRVVRNLTGRDALEARSRHLETGSICKVSSRI